jgi:hypothetical protein
MDYDAAVRVLRKGGSLPVLAEAVGLVAARAATDDAAAFDLIPALNHRGFVAEQAVLALHRLLSVPIPDDRRSLDFSPAVWFERLSDHMGVAVAGRAAAS